ncbi:MAG: hypothetical protein KGL95_01760, partial [Patescibacteria group bacterium]|nr:hypothetical protein [Patescibacteria group bacterium]
KTANELYRESGSNLSFKEWLNNEKKNGSFIFNKPLNEKIRNMETGQRNFHSADATTSPVSNTANSVVSKAKSISKSSLFPQSHREIIFLIAGIGLGIGLVLIVKCKK